MRLDRYAVFDVQAVPVRVAPEVRTAVLSSGFDIKPTANVRLNEHCDTTDGRRPSFDGSRAPMDEFENLVVLAGSGDDSQTFPGVSAAISVCQVKPVLFRE